MLLAVFAVINGESFEGKLSSDEDKPNNLDNAANLEDLAVNPTEEDNDEDAVDLQDETKGRYPFSILLHPEINFA